MGILAHHLFQYSGCLRGTAFATVLQAIGYLSVAEFFFLSGYGLSMSYEKKRDEYIRKFPEEKILPFYLVILILTVGWVIIKIFFHERITMSTIGKSLLFGETVIEGGWYLQVQLLLYIIWFIAFKSHGADSQKLIHLTIIELLYCGAMIGLGYSTTWYESVMAFPIGIVWAEHRFDIDDRFQSFGQWIKVEMILFILFVTAFGVSHIIPFEFARIVAKMISAVLFVALLTLTIYKISLNCKIARFLGNISLEIYTMQFVFLTLFHGLWINIEIPYLYIVCVVLATCFAAALFKTIVNKIYKVCRKLTGKLCVK